MQMKLIFISCPFFERTRGEQTLIYALILLAIVNYNQNVCCLRSSSKQSRRSNKRRTALLFNNAHINRFYVSCFSEIIMENKLEIKIRFNLRGFSSCFLSRFRFEAARIERRLHEASN
jgi:hypothetical protein